MNSLRVISLFPMGSSNKRVELSDRQSRVHLFVVFFKFSFNLVEQALLRSGACSAYIELWKNISAG